jgi:diguanylate cyclase (GGDEF)-like protein
MTMRKEIQLLDRVSGILRLDISLDGLLTRLAELVRTEARFGTVVISLLDKSGLFLEKKAVAGKDISKEHPLARQKVAARFFERLLSPNFKVSHSYYFRHERDAAAVPTGSADPQQMPESVDIDLFPLLETPPPATHDGDETRTRKRTTSRTRRLKTRPAELPCLADLLLVPLHSTEHRLFGMISLYSSVWAAGPDVETVMILEVIADYAMRAIENALIFQQTQKRFAQVNALSRVAAAVNSVLELPVLLNKIATIIHDTFGYRHALILLADKNELELRVRAQVGFDEHEVDDLRIPIEPGAGVAGTVAFSGRYALIPDREAYKGPYIEVRKEAQSELTVPIKLKDRIIGVLSVDSDRKSAFTEEDVQLLDQFANQIAVAIHNAQLFETLQSELSSRTALVKVGTAISSVRDLKSLFQAVLEILAHTFKFNNAAIMLTNEDETELVLQAQHGEFPGAMPVELRVRIGEEGVTGLAAHSGKTLNIGDVRKFPSYVRGLPDARSELAIPLKHANKVIGVLNLESKEANAYTERDVALLEMFAVQLAVAIDNVRLHEQTVLLAATDGITGVYNHRYFQEHLQAELKRAKRLKHPLSLIMLDIDHFKHYNDTNGHQKGDLVLVEVAKILVGAARAEIDIVARYGGEEFCLLLPETDKAAAMKIAERIRRKVQRSAFPGKEQQPPGTLTVSLGVASMPEDARAPEKLVARADAALYKAKNNGRNRVVAV